VNFLLNSHGSLRPRKEHHTIGVSFLAYKTHGNKNEEGRKRSKQQECKEHELSLSLKSLGGRSGFGTWGGFDSIELSLGVNALALVLNVKCWKLGCLEWWWLEGIYSPQPPHSRWGWLLSMDAPNSPVRHRTLPGALATLPNR
jgi:hypothetical protein